MKNIIIIALISFSCSKEELLIVEKSEKCTLIPDAGNCKAQFKRYYFDPVDKCCKEFIWGGCSGTVPFETLNAPLCAPPTFVAAQ